METCLGKLIGLRKLVGMKFNLCRSWLDFKIDQSSVPKFEIKWSIRSKFNSWFEGHVNEPQAIRLVFAWMVTITKTMMISFLPRLEILNLSVSQLELLGWLQLPRWCWSISPKPRNSQFISIVTKGWPNASLNMSRLLYDSYRGRKMTCCHNGFPLASCLENVDAGEFGLVCGWRSHASTWRIRDQMLP